MTQCVHTPPSADLHFRLGDLSDALISARQNLYESRHQNHKQLADRSADPLQVGDTVIIRTNERMTFTNYLDPE